MTSHRVCSRAQEVLRDEYRLAHWVRKPKERRQSYFAWCDRAPTELRHITGTEPPDEALLLLIVAVLVADESFAGHVKTRPGSWIAEDGNWDKLYHAGACTILEEYRLEVRNGAWPL